MDAQYIENFRAKHYKKRRMMGSEKERALRSMVQERTDPSVYVRNQAKSIMREGNLLKSMD